jgi:hypothetical protein
MEMIMRPTSVQLSAQTENTTETLPVSPPKQRAFRRLVARLFNRRKVVTDEVVLYCVHRAFFLWAATAVGFTGSIAVRQNPQSAHLWGWVEMAVILTTLLMLLFDLNTWKLLFWIGVLAFIAISSMYLEQLKHVPVLSPVLHRFVGFRPMLDPGFALTLSWTLMLLWLGSIVHTIARGRKAFSPNGIEEWFAGDGPEITDRSGLKFRVHYRDLLESALGFGAGDIEAVDNTGKVVKRWENVVGLIFRWPKLDRVLHQRAAVVQDFEEIPAK